MPVYDTDEGVLSLPGRDVGSVEFALGLSLFGDAMMRSLSSLTAQSRYSLLGAPIPGRDGEIVMTWTSVRVITASAILLFMLDPGKHDGLTTYKSSVGRVIVLLSYAHSFRGGRDCLRIGRLKSTVFPRSSQPAGWMLRFWTFASGLLRWGVVYLRPIHSMSGIMDPARDVSS